MDADDDDVLGWELDQLQKLKRLADAYGWDDDSPQYKAKLKQVQQLAKQRTVGLLGKGGKEPKGKASKIDWQFTLDFKAKDWDEAKGKLAQVHSGSQGWLPDRRSAQSTTGGMVTRRFICKDTTEGKTYLARIINLNNGSWKLQSGGVEDLDQEEEKEESSSEETPEPTEPDVEEAAGGESSRRGAAAPGRKSRLAPAPAAAPAAASAVKPATRKRRA